MKIFLHAQDSRDVEVIEASEESRLVDLVDLHPQDTVWSDDEGDEALDPSILVGTIGPGRRIFCGRCHRVIVAVRYNGETVSRDFRPGAPIRRVLRWAIREPEFGISDPAIGDYDFKMASCDLVPDVDQLVGQFVGDDCEVIFDLRPAEKFQGHQIDVL